MSHTKRNAIVVTAGGGPAPGINTLLAQLIQECESNGVMLLGILRGFAGVLSGREEQVRVLTSIDGAGIANLGGCVLGMARDTFKEQGQIAEALEFLSRLERRHDVKIRLFCAIGGDDTLTSLNKLAVASGASGAMDLGHFPKTIDCDYGPTRDLSCNPFTDAPDVQVQGPVTFGYASFAEHLARNVIVPQYLDLRTGSGAWQIDQVMGRYSGFSVDAIARVSTSMLGQIKLKVANFSFKEPLLLIPEMFSPGTSFDRLVEICAALIAERVKSENFGILLISEGIIPLLNEAAKARLLSEEERQCPHGHPDLEMYNLLGPLAEQLFKRLTALGVPVKKFRTQKFGYDARCIPPNRFDEQYCQCAAIEAVRRVLADERGNFSHFYDGHQIVSVPFSSLVNPAGRVARLDMQGITKFQP